MSPLGDVSAYDLNRRCGGEGGRHNRGQPLHLTILSSSLISEPISWPTITNILIDAPASCCGPRLRFMQFLPSGVSVVCNRSVRVSKANSDQIGKQGEHDVTASVSHLAKYQTMFQHCHRVNRHRACLHSSGSVRCQPPGRNGQTKNRRWHRSACQFVAIHPAQRRAVFTSGIHAATLSEFIVSGRLFVGGRVAPTPLVAARFTI